MAVLDLTNHLGKVRNRIDKAGIELEGGWNRLPAVIGNRIVHDGSVFHRGPEGNRRVALPAGMPGNSIVGEAPSEPLEPAAVAKWIKLAYPQWVDDTCGLHVHMSFKDARHYELLTKVDYQDTMFAYLKEWAAKEEADKPGTFPDDHYIWDRFAGTNRYCLAKFWPEKQIMKQRKDYAHEGEGHRYTALNFCYGLHKTVECRILPMMADADLAIRGVRRVIDITNACLVILAKRTNLVLAEQVMLLPEGLYEEIDQEVL